jgi:hypothetical protein
MMRFGQMRHGSASRLEQPLAPVGSQGAAAFWCSDSNKTNPVVMPGLACTGEGRCPRHPDIRKHQSLRHDGSR